MSQPKTLSISNPLGMGQSLPQQLHRLRFTVHSGRGLQYDSLFLYRHNYTPAAEQPISLENCILWCGIAMAAYLGKVIFSSLSTALSHTATYHTLRDLRKNLIAKLSRVPWNGTGHSVWSI